jgi:hypothetical protein
MKLKEMMKEYLPKFSDQDIILAVTKYINNSSDDLLDCRDIEKLLNAIKERNLLDKIYERI